MVEGYSKISGLLVDVLEKVLMTETLRDGTGIVAGRWGEENSFNWIPKEDCFSYAGDF